MNPSLPTLSQGLRIFSACLLSWLLITMPFVQIAAATRQRSDVTPQSAQQNTATNASAAENVFLNSPVPQPAPEPFAAVITATKDDGLAAATTVAPGGTIDYTVNISNTGDTAATNVQFSDTIDAHTTLVPGSPVAATSDSYNTIGNVQISIPDGSTDLLANDFDPDTGNNTGMTATAETKSSTNCTGGCSNNVTISADGSFTYNPPVGFSGTDTFTYTANSGTASVTTTVTITVANRIWFINNNAGACTSNCDGRLSHPFTSLAAFNAANDGAAGHPGDNDWIFVFESSTAYTGPATLRNGQKFIGQDATASLVSLTGFTQPSGTDPLPVMNSGNATIVQITTSVAATNGINLLSGNMLRGFTVGNTTGAKISGTGFGTLIVGNSASPDVTLNGTGQALNLSTGTLSVTGRFVSVTTTSSTTTGINLAGVADSDGAGGGSFSFSSTTVSGSTTQGILVGTSTADLNFGNTSVTGGTDAISLQNNSAGTRTFGTITTSGNSGAGFIHGAGGGAVNVTGATSITNPGGNGIDIDSSNANISFAATTVNKNSSAGIGVDLTNNATRTISFTSLTVTTTTGFALNTNNAGTVNATTGSLTQSGAGGGAASLTNTALGLTFTSVSSNGGANGLIFSGGTGTFTSGTTSLLNNAGIGLLMSSAAVNANFGNTTVNSSAGDGVDLSSTTGSITFADLDITPDANLRGLDAQNNTGTITSTSGDVATTGAAAVFIDGPAGRTPLAMVLTNVDSTNSTADGVNLTDVSGSFAVNDAGTATNVTNSTGTGITVNNSTATVNFGNTSVTGSGNSNADDTGTGVFLTNNNGGVTFGSLTITPDSGERGLLATDTDGATAAGTITTTSGTITTTNDRAIEITGASAAARTPLAVALTAVHANGGTNGIIIQSTSGSFTVNGTGTTDGSGGTVQAMTSSGVRMVDATNITLKNMNLTGNGTAQTVAGSAATCGGDLVGGNNLSCVANLFLDNISTVTLDNLNVTNSGQMGINGSDVSAFSLANSSVTGNGNEGFENGLTFQNLTGTCAITNSLIKDNFAFQVNINNIANSSTLTLNVTGTRTNNAYPTMDTSTTEIGKTVAVATSNQAFLFNTSTTATNLNATINFTGVVFNNAHPGNAVLMNPIAASGTFGGTTTNSSFDTTGGGLIIQAQNGMGGTYNVTNSEFNRTALQHILYSGLNPFNSTLQGTIQGNTIGTAGQSGSACFPTSGANCVGIDVNLIGGTGAIRMRIGGVGQGNTVQQFDNTGIRFTANGAGTMHANVENNTVQNPLGLIARGIDTNIGTTAGATVAGCFGITGNTVSGTFEDPGVGTQFGIHTRVRFTATHRLPGYGGAADDDTAVAAFISGNNPGAGGKVFSESPAGSNGYPGGAACTTPLLFTEGFESTFSASSLLTSLAIPTLFDLVAPSAPCRAAESRYPLLNVTAASEPPLTQHHLDSIVAAAIQRWTATGLKQNQIAAIGELRFAVGDLDGEYLGEVNGNTIVVDRDAQGKGWFTDITPMDDLEFGGRTWATRSYTNPYSSAAGRVDLLTAIEHEIGHRLGLVDTYAYIDRNSIMYGYLTVGERRVPAAGQAANAQPGSLVGLHHLKLKNRELKGSFSSQKRQLRSHAARSSRSLVEPFAGETITANVASLPAGGTITIKFQVTVNNPPNLSLLNPPRVSNQGSVSGSNFSTVSTDDPETILVPADATVTLIDLFDTTTTLVSDLNPSNFGDQVTFTATVAENPPQGTANPTGTVDFIDTSNGNAVICNDVPISGSAPHEAQCQTSSLTAGTHNIRADYSGDGNFDPSQSNVVAQVVIACTTDPIVTSTADSGAGTLREALANVCTGDTITFNIAGAGPHTITLTTGELAVAKNVTVNNNSGESITISGNNASRVFNINSGKTVGIVGLTITGGSSTDGGAIVNDGSLTVVNSTLSGNAASADGGAISTTATGTSLTLINTTLSGNTAAGSGGGLIVLGGTVSIINSTITNNKADSDANSLGDGGGIRANAGTTTLKNTIVAGNLNEDGVSDAADDISGTVDPASSFNLIGTGGSGGLTNGVNNNQVGVANAGLGALANNGGTTQTHALLPTSSAVEAGSNANLPTDAFDLDGDANTGETLPVDQRGTGFPRVADSADANATATVDIGAFELHPSIEDIGNQTTAEDTALSGLVFNIGDGTGALISSVTGTSSNQTLVPDANIIITGSGSTRSLSITPALNANSPSDGTATITITVTATNGRTATDTFVLTVTEVNDNPDAVNDTLTAVDEDSGTRIIPFADLLGNDTAGPANESGQTITVTNVSNPVGGTVAINGTNVEFTLTANFSGTASFDYTISDNGTTNGALDAKTDTATASFAVNGINDPPSFTKGADQTVNEDAGPQTVIGWATNISAGPGESQTLTFNVMVTGTTGNLAFASAPAINATTGTLTYTTAADTNGTANLSVTLSDNGSNTPPNSNTSAAQTFTITVNAVNDAPTFQLGANPSVGEDAGPQTINGFAFNFQPGPVTATDEAGQTLVGYTLTLTGSTGGLTFSSAPAIDTSGTLTFTATGNSSGTATFDVVATDSGSGTPPNVNQSAPVSFTITVNSVNDPPVNTVPGPQSTNQNTPLVFSSGNGNQISVADVDAGGNTIQVTLTATNGTLTLSTTAGLNFSFSDGNGTGAGDGTNDATMTFRGTITDINAALNGMTFNPTMGFSGAAGLTITTNDLGNTGSGGPQTDTDSVNIQVSTNISIQDAQVVEPSTGSVNMIFTVTLSAPAPASGVSVNFTTMDEPPAISHATAGLDYTTTSGTVNFASGEQFKTILVPVLSDNLGESNETFLVVLSSPLNGNIADGTATGTILNMNQPGTVLISELRTSGPGGAGDDFVEIYNNSNSAITVTASDASAGYGLFKMGADCNATPVLIGVIPNGTVIPARGHYLFVGSAYSLANYGGTGAAAGDQTLLSDIESDRNVALFTTAGVTSISSANRLDAVGFGTNTGGVCDLLREGTTLTPLSGSVLDYSYFRDECGKKGNPAIFGPCPTGGLTKDSNVNADDFIFADTSATVTPAGQRLGAPGPQNLGNPLLRNGLLATLLIDANVGAPASPNRVRDLTPMLPNAMNGTLSLRRRFVNNTGSSVTRLRFRIVDISSISVPGGIADLRALTSGAITVTGVTDAGTCTASGAGSPPCTITVQGTTLEQPPTQALGGALNSTLSAGTITLATPLASGASINLQFLLGVQQTGSFKFFFNIEALP